MPTRSAVTELYEMTVKLGRDGQTAYVALSTQILDDELQKAIIARMPNYSSKVHDAMFEYPAPLASFAAKIDVAYAFGVIDRKLHSTLSTVRRIRNQFAHPKEETHFRSPHIQPLLKKLGGYNDVIDPYALFGNEFHECWAALDPSHQLP